jgi:hypothetical protein
MIEGDRLQGIEWPGKQVHGLGADRRNSAHLRAADESGQLRDSVDSGRQWRSVGLPPLHSSPLIAPPRLSNVLVEFSPLDLDHALLTSAFEQHVTHDGGETWARIDFPGRTLDLVEFSSVDGRVMWAFSQNGLLRSTDGGRRFEPVAGWSGTGSFRRPQWIKADAVNVNVAFVHMGDSTLQYFDVARSQHDVRAVEWSVFVPSPATPELWYVGLAGESSPDK